MPEVPEKSRWRKTGTLDSDNVEVDFAPEVRDAFRDLAAAVHFSKHVSPEMKAELQDWAEGKPASVRGAMATLAITAQEVFKHIHATGDEKARKAWNDICGELTERDCTLTSYRQRAR